MESKVGGDDSITFLKDDDTDCDSSGRDHRSSYRGGPVESVCGWNVFISGLHASVTGK